MKNTIAVPLGLLAALTLSGAAMGPSAQEEVVGDDETIELAAEIDALRADLEQTTALLDQTLAYLATQADASAAMAATLDEAEALGFTAGINHGSREVLLAGWRAQLDRMQSNVPKRRKSDEERSGR